MSDLQKSRESYHAAFMEGLEASGYKSLDAAEASWKNFRASLGSIGDQVSGSQRSGVDEGRLINLPSQLRDQAIFPETTTTTDGLESANQPPNLSEILDTSISNDNTDSGNVSVHQAIQSSPPVIRDLE
ncbi:MAG: hypothetical protein ACKVQS_02730 [Fimbriimonadaceae bacterium]